jgi:hypothetical protein
VPNPEISLEQGLDPEERPLLPPADDDSDVQTLTHLGMSAPDARAALARYNGDIEAAAEEFLA